MKKRKSFRFGHPLSCLDKIYMKNALRETERRIMRSGCFHRPFGCIKAALANEDIDADLGYRV